MIKAETFLPLHGGDLEAASAQYGIPVDQWVDLSTGINPEPYPVDSISSAAFNRLPYLSDAFNQAVASYYKADNVIPVSGTQAAIQALPKLLLKQPILIPETGYKEHEKHWSKTESVIDHYPSCHSEEAIDYIQTTLTRNPQQHLLVVNPNNPTGVIFSREQLLNWASQLAEGSYLIVDEAFMDLTPDKSLLENSLPDNIVVLRSFGKFFGLAGIRLGFVFSNTGLIQKLSDALGLWQVNGPAQALAIQALTDRDWQTRARISIAQNAQMTQAIFLPLITQYEVERAVHAGLFSSYFLNKKDALKISQFFAKRGVLLRVIFLGHEKAILRIGLLSERELDAKNQVVQAINNY
ncbi:threonine-phosphate decarboxylase [Alkalimarinus alittae]|uniref:Aminotransferase n=1 Tax=Alkalimarinus alittae TaxID=2961619 RepID=A0ABY6N631_9ALTE|nr:threonine-phosphate decarboxylase [Alkalimarinus alittae]UZE97495.1 pyridoxal phosphate-dependent class II aminotransferase [Alkalimarinus alittae]